MTILPNMLLTGILAITFSLLYAAGAIFWAHRKHGGVVLMTLSVTMLLFGGGIFPPILSFLIGAAALGLRSHPSQKPVSRFNRCIGHAWYWILPACCISWLALLPGIAALDYFFGFDSTAFTLLVMLAAFSFLYLAHWSSIQYDRLALKRLEYHNEKPLAVSAGENHKVSESG